MRELDRVCDRFEAAWKETPDRPPRLEDFLPPVGSLSRAPYFRELFEIELHYRRDTSGPAIDEYLQRFSEFATLIAEHAADCSASSNPDGSEVAPSTVADGDAGTKVVLPPVRVPGYEIGSVLGRGAMGVVHRARQVRLNREVALKILLEGSPSTEGEIPRFRIETEAVARLNHPGIVQVHDAGQCRTEVGATVAYLAMEYCPGGNLTAKLAGKPLAPREAAALVEQLARAVHAAHTSGVVHRDLKPSNVLLDAGGHPKVADFGLAKLLDGVGQTYSGALLGTPAYMAPEQAEGKNRDVGPPADTYALGAILYECLTARPPFKGPTVAETLLQVCNDEPVPVRRLQPETPRDLETIALKCLHKEAWRRYGSAAELADDLNRFLRAERIRARPTGMMEKSWRWATRHRALTGLYAVSVLAGLLLLGLGFWFSDRLGTIQARLDARAGKQANLPTEGIAVEEVAAAPVLEGEPYTLAYSSDSRQLAAGTTKRFGGKGTIWDLAGRKQTITEAADVGAWLDFTADLGQGLYKTTKGEFKIHDLKMRKDVQTLQVPGESLHYGRFSPDGKYVAAITSEGSGVRVWSVTTGMQVWQTSHDLLTGDMTFDLTWAHTGNELFVCHLMALPRLEDRPAAGVIEIRGAGNGRLHRELPLPAGRWRTPVIRASMDGKLLAVSDYPAGRVVIGDVVNGKVIHFWETKSYGEPLRDLALSPDGRFLVTVGADGGRLWDLSGQCLARFGDKAGVLTRVKYAPDGRSLATGGQQPGKHVRIWRLREPEASTPPKR